MSVWRYRAIASEGGGGVRRGEHFGESAAEVRAALRRAGLQVIALRRLGGRGDADAWWRRRVAPLRASAAHHLRTRRRERVADLLDGLATMLESGLPLLEAVETIERSATGGASMRRMLVRAREGLRGGESFAAAIEPHSGWFDRVDVAMIRAGEHGGELPEVLRTLAVRRVHAGEISRRLISALAYPAVIACVAIGVVIFLSTRTLPDLVRILDGADIATPRLTFAVMTIGRAAAAYALWIFPAGVALGALAGVVGLVVRRLGVDLFAPLVRLTPETVRRTAVARVARGMAELLRVGVPAVDALRVVSPTVSGPAAGGLRPALESAADRIEHGESFARALDDPRFFDAEFRRLIAIGETSGALHELLDRIGERYERRARRMIDRLAALLEPAAILLLAVLVGIVVMAAVLPLLRLQEVIG